MLRAVAAASLLAWARAALFAARDGLVAQGWGAPALRLVGLDGLLGTAWALPFALGLAALAGGRAAARRPAPAIHADPGEGGHATPSRSRAAARAALAVLALALGYGFATGRWPSSSFHVPGTDSPRAWAAHGAAALVAAGATLVALGRAPRVLVLCGASLGGGAVLGTAGLLLALRLVGPAAGSPSVLLVSLDTLRADRLGCYGHERPTSPHLDAFASRATRFTQAYTPDPWTLTAHMSLLTGLPPSVHGVDVDRALPREVETLAATFARAGHRTAAVVDTVAWLHPGYGFARGFDVYDRVEGTAAAKVPRLVRVLEAARGHPSFVFAHLMDAHSDEHELPYESEPPDLRAFLREGSDLDAWRGGDAAGGASARLQRMNAAGIVPGEPARRALVDLYEAGVASLDRRLGELLGWLETSGALDDTIVVVLSDHGEAFYEHGEALHDQAHGECLRVPLIVHVPGRRRDVEPPPAVVDRLVSLIDVRATLLDLCGIEGPRAGVRAVWRGRSFADVWQEGGGPAAAASAGADLPSPTAGSVPIDRGTRWPLGLRTRAHALVPREDGGLSLYALREDPGEHDDLSDDPDAVAAAAAAWRARDAWRALVARAREALEGGARAVAPLPPEAVRRLEALGYLGGR